MKTAISTAAMTKLLDRIKAKATTASEQCSMATITHTKLTALSRLSAFKEVLDLINDAMDESGVPR